MATEAQINANRQNAEKSTGPRTPEGKAAVSQNALKHGLFASPTVISGEDQADFDLHHDAMFGEMRPVGVMETMLAERIISLSWRLRRAERMQNQAIDEMIEYLKPSPIDHYIYGATPMFLRTDELKFHVPEPKMALGRVARRDWSNDRVLDRMMMYERRIESSMFKTMNKLKQLQIMRRIEDEGVAEQRAATQMSPAADHEGGLKKQTQFAPTIMGARAFMKKDYENNSRTEVGGNKANQSQFHKLAGRAGGESGCEVRLGRKIMT